MTRPELGRDDLVLCAGTVPRASFRERVVAARDGGFAGISLRVGDVRRARAELPDREIRAFLDGEGITVAEVEALLAWRPNAPVGPRTPGEFEVFAAAEAVGARAVSVVEGPGAPLPVEAAAEAFGALCDRAARRGLRVHVEFWPASGLDLETAAAIVVAADRPNGGLMVDTWHLARTRNGEKRLRTIPGTRILSVQMSDSPLVDTPEDDYVRAAMERRCIPGEGVLDLVGFVRLLDEIGSTAPIGAEVMATALAAEPPVEVACRVGEALRAVVHRARRTS